MARDVARRFVRALGQLTGFVPLDPPRSRWGRKAREAMTKAGVIKR